MKNAASYKRAMHHLRLVLSLNGEQDFYLLNLFDPDKRNQVGFFLSNGTPLLENAI